MVVIAAMSANGLLYTVLGFILVLMVIGILYCVRIVPQASEFVIERLGTYRASWKAGLHLLVPFIDQIAKKVSVKEQVFDFKPQPVITKDNVTISATTLRNIIGEMELDQTLTSRDVINSKITETLDRATDRWGIKVNRVELKNIEPPKQIREAMEKQMRAERERREAILQAEGKKKSDILVAEGEKQARILTAEAEKQTVIRRPRSSSRARFRALPDWRPLSRNCLTNLRAFTNLL